MSDVFREVDEDYRRERMIAFWRRYGTIVFAAMVLAVIGAWAFNYLRQQAETRKAAQTTELSILLAQGTPGNEVNAANALAVYETRADASHALLARFAEAALRLRAGTPDIAAKLYHQIADDPAVDSDLRDLAIVRLGYLAVDQANPEPLIPQLQAIAGKDSPWSSSAREAAALLTAKAGQREAAATMFSELARDPRARPDIAERARALAEIYRGK